MWPYVFNPNSIEVELNPILFPEEDIEWMQVDALCVTRKNMNDMSNDNIRKAFEEGNEMLLLVTELTVNENSSRFIAQFGSEDYTRASETLMISERQDAIKQEILELEI